MIRISMVFILSITMFLLSCDTSTDPELQTSPAGVWQWKNGAEFSYMALFEDNTFLYAENDLTVESPEENGLEVGTYSFNAETGMLTFNIIYDDNAPGPGNDSGVGDVGTPVVVDAKVSDDGNSLSLVGGEFVLTASVIDAASPVVGVWSATNGPEFNYLLLLADNTFLYAENDLSAESAEENGMEAGTYTYNADSGTLSFSLAYDDNDPGNDSGVGDIGTPVVINAVLLDDNKTLSIADGALVLSREFSSDI